ncbi:JM141 [macacine gammaherpesvirus 11]|uniref:JM141 n=2 Tax=macacine gammaherpesvirus 11 TaxID=2560570 RepID=G9JME9_9GAMA|nr:JM141 [Macaca fuscata rhadinovirus]AAT00118.1 JM141 [Macaca fuscata rhadinovirus]AEW87666.1 JM141 [Macaca fuscata rhadinovirus]AEW87836.1 JM141 [Macaca fuscata rhadinovirus]
MYDMRLTSLTLFSMFSRMSRRRSLRTGPASGWAARHSHRTQMDAVWFFVLRLSVGCIRQGPCDWSASSGVGKVEGCEWIVACCVSEPRSWDSDHVAEKTPRMLGFSLAFVELNASSRSSGRWLSRLA